MVMAHTVAASGEQSSSEAIEPGLLRSLEVCLLVLADSHRFYGGTLPTSFQVLERIKGWQDAQPVREFVSQRSSDCQGEDDAKVVAHLLESAAAQGNAIAQEGLSTLEAALANANDPDRWVEVMAMEEMLVAVDRVHAAQHTTQVKAFGQEDDVFEHEVALPLIHWDTGVAGAGPFSTLGSVSDVDELAMQERLRVLLKLRLRGGLVICASPLVRRPDGRPVLFVQLVPASLR